MLEKLKQWIKETKNMGIEDKSNIYNTDLKEFIEFKNMLDLSVVLVTSALNRDESRGAHYRIDNLESKEDFEASTIVTKINNTLKVELCK